MTTEATVTTLAKFDPIAAQIAEFKEKDANLSFDLEDRQGNKDARSYVAKLRKVTTTIATVHKEAKAEALAYGRMVDGKKNEYTAEVKTIIDRWWVPIKEIEQRETKRMADEAEALRLKKEAVEAERIADIERREAEMAEKERLAKEEEDRKAREHAEKVAEENTKLLVAKTKLEDEKRKLEAEAEAQRREKLVREAAEKLVESAKKIAAEKAEREKQEAVEAAEERHREEQEAERVQKLVAEEAERKRVADVEHRNKVENEIHAYLSKTITNAGTVDQIMADLRHGAIPNVQIIY